jgi:hypothetical protein
MAVVALTAATSTSVPLALLASHSPNSSPLGVAMIVA